MQALTSIPTPTAETVAYGLLCFIGGMTVPTRYGIERLEGFGRFMAAKFPYRPEPGMDEETAMQEAVGNDDSEEAQTTNTDENQR